MGRFQVKYLIFSDIHGSASACEKILQHFNNLKADYLVLLGDVLYHGPRNPLPQGHDPKKVAELLNAYADKIICCRGNCDAEVEEMVLKFPVLQSYSFIIDQGIRIFCTHGHIYAPCRADGNIAVAGSKIPSLSGLGAIFYGHTHVQVLEKNKSGLVVCNPGSISLPKENSPAGFATYENGLVALYNLDGELLKELNVCQ